MDRLDADEAALWHAFKNAAESVRTKVAADIAAATGLSDPDFGILTRIVELGGGRLRQNQLAESIGFHRSRLSHQLTRMEERGLVTREPSGDGVEVVATQAGRAAVKKARPIHAAAVRTHLLERIGQRDRAAFRRALALLTDE